MTYSNGYITVPESGIYFIYFNVYAEVLSFRTTPGYRNPGIYVDSNEIGFTEEYFGEKREPRSQYLGMLWRVNKGSRLSVRAGGGVVRYYFGGRHTCFGAWKVD